MKTANYQKCYSILGVFQDDDWETVRSAYKRQIRRWHPDRFQNLDQRKIAEDKCKEINISYQMLDDYYQKFGALPPENESRLNVSAPAGDARYEPNDHADSKPEPYSGTGQDRDTASSPPEPARRSYMGILLAVTIITTGYMLSEPLFIDHDGVAQTGSANNNMVDSGLSATNPESPAVPATTSSDGAARETRPAEWQNNTKNPEHEPGLSVATGRLPYLTRGSTKQDVLAIQGRPLRETDTTWDYGLSRINFQHGKVIDWYENPMNPLIVQR